MASWTHRLAAGVLLAAATLGAHAQEPATRAGATPETQPATDPIAVKVLDQIQQASATIKTLKADVRYDSINHILDDTQRRFGTLIYSAGPPAGFYAHFDRLVVDGKAVPQDRTYIFDGKWMVEKIIEKQTDPDTGRDRVSKQFKKTQIVAPNAPPEESNPLASGRGPFPLPINMNTAVILARYQVTLVPPTPGDKSAPEDHGRPLDAIHLKLLPRPGQRMNFTEAHLWYLRDSLLPCQVRTLEIVDGSPSKETIVDLRDPKVNDPVDQGALDSSEPQDRAGWEIEVQPWTQK